MLFFLHPQSCKNEKLVTAASKGAQNNCIAHKKNLVFQTTDRKAVICTKVIAVYAITKRRAEHVANFSGTADL